MIGLQLNVAISSIACTVHIASLLWFNRLQYWKSWNWIDLVGMLFMSCIELKSVFALNLMKFEHMCVCATKLVLNRPCKCNYLPLSEHFVENWLHRSVLNSVRKSCSGFLKVKANLIAHTTTHSHLRHETCILNCVLIKRSVVYSIFYSRLIFNYY